MSQRSPPWSQRRIHGKELCNLDLMTHHKALHFAELPSSLHRGAPSTHDFPMTKTELRDYAIQRQGRHVNQLEDSLIEMRAKMRYTVKRANDYEGYLQDIAQELEFTLQSDNPPDLKSTVETVYQFVNRHMIIGEGYGNEDIPPHPWNHPGPRQVDVRTQKLADITLPGSPTWHPILSPGNQVLSPIWSPGVEDICLAAWRDANVRAANNKALDRGELSPNREDHLQRVAQDRPHILEEGMYPNIEWDDFVPPAHQKSVLEVWKCRDFDLRDKHISKRNGGAGTDEDDSSDDEPDFGPFTRYEHNKGARRLRKRKFRQRSPPQTISLLPNGYERRMNEGRLGDMLPELEVSRTLSLLVWVPDPPANEVSPLASSPSVRPRLWINTTPPFNGVAQEPTYTLAPEGGHIAAPVDHSFDLAVDLPPIDFPIQPRQRLLPPPWLTAPRQPAFRSRFQALAVPGPTLAPITAAPLPGAIPRNLPPLHTLILQPAFEFTPPVNVRTARQNHVGPQAANVVNQEPIRSTIVTVNPPSPSLYSAAMSISSGGSPEPTLDDAFQQDNSGTAAANPPDLANTQGAAAPANPPPTAQAPAAANNAPPPVASALRGRKRKAPAMEQAPILNTRLRQKQRVNYKQ